MIYSLNLLWAGLVTGVFLMVVHAVAVAQPRACQAWLKNFPRSRVLGTVLILAAGIWSLILIRTMDLGEFARLRNPLTVGVVAGTFLAWRYMEEFLAVRALGMLAMLAAEPLLEAAFLRPEGSRLLLVVLAYAWIGLGLFWVGLPWLLRDQIQWLLARAGRFRAAAWAGLAYGVVLVGCALIFWR
jgi:hypothetical protein